MATVVEKKILKNVSVVVVDDAAGSPHVLTLRAKSVDVDISKDEVEVTAMGGDGWHEFEPGLAAGQIAIEFYQGFDAGSIHEVLFPHWDASDEFVIRIGPEGDIGSDTNPVFEAPVKLFGYKFITGAVGEAAVNPVTMRLTGPPSIDTT